MKYLCVLLLSLPQFLSVRDMFEWAPTGRQFINKERNTRANKNGRCWLDRLDCGCLWFDLSWRVSPLSWISAFSSSARTSEAIVSQADTCRWNDAGWYDMTEEEERLGGTLGWTSQMWESEDPATHAPSSSQEWKSLAKENEAPPGSSAIGKTVGITRNACSVDFRTVVGWP